MSFRYNEPIPSDFDSFEEYEYAHEMWESAMDDYCDEYMESRRDY